MQDIELVVTLIRIISLITVRTASIVQMVTVNLPLTFSNYRSQNLCVLTYCELGPALCQSGLVY